MGRANSSAGCAENSEPRTEQLGGALSIGGLNRSLKTLFIENENGFHCQCGDDSLCRGRRVDFVSKQYTVMTLAELLANGGWAMVPIYLCSAAVVAIFCKKMLEFRSRSLTDVSWLEETLDALRRSDFEEARTRAGATSNPAGRVILAMLGIVDERPDRVEAEARRVGSLEIQNLEEHVGGLSFVAQAAPLLGLLGTVIGMVELFMGLQGTATATVDAALLASGIWKALLTTAAGLAVAVPALAAYSYLNSRTDRFRLLLQDCVQRTLTALPVPDGEESADGV